MAKQIKGKSGTTYIIEEDKASAGDSRGRRKGRKYDYLYIVQGNWGEGTPWKDLTASDSRKEAHRYLRMFNWKGSPGGHVRHRMIRRRFLRKDYED